VFYQKSKCPFFLPFEAAWQTIRPSSFKELGRILFWVDYIIDFRYNSNACNSIFMSYFEIVGGKKLNGEIEVKGAKNAALKAVAAALLSREKWTITNFPFIEDTKRILEMIEDLGVKVKRGNKRVEIQADTIKTTKFEDKLAKKLRASIILAGPVLARMGKVRMHHPGGCVIGKRPIDMFLDGFQKFGAKVKWENAHFQMSVKKMKGAKIFFPKVTVTGTETMMITAVLAEGETILENAAMEPEILMLAEFLNKCGAKISGAGTPTIRIKGVKKIRGGKLELIPDRIETGTFAILGALAGGRIRITKCDPDHIRAFLAYLEKAGVKIEEKKNELIVWGAKNLKPANFTTVSTHEYPGFATDLQPPFTLLMTQAKGSSPIHDSIFENRFMFTDALNLMGAHIVMNDSHQVTVNGPTKLSGRKIVSPDLRAGITLVLAGLIASGKTKIENIYQIDRGYEKIEERLQKLGADIKRVKK
jgi:UDP-N-acetylglucosamine 1-carboxyvinyltransferase